VVSLSDMQERVFMTRYLVIWQLKGFLKLKIGISIFIFQINEKMQKNGKFSF